MKFYILSGVNASARLFKAGRSVSIYFETESRKILYGLGGNHSFLDNANRLGVDLAQVDALILPSARDNDCGSLKRFLSINNRAKIYAQSSVWDDYYKKTFWGKVPCGIAKLKGCCADRFVPVKDCFAFNTSAMIIKTEPSTAAYGEYFKLVNMKVRGEKCQGEILDNFSHEISLAVVTEKGCALLVNKTHSGLNGVLNAAKLLDLPAVAVIGELEIFNRTKTKSKFAFRRELADVACDRNVALHLDGLKAAFLNEVKNAFVNTSKLSAGDVVEV